MKQPIRIVLATSNPYKTREVATVLSPLGFELLSLSELGKELSEPEEDGVTFEENARIKAIAYAKATGLCCLSEDSGLEVDALGGAPGVHSARYADAGGPREERDRQNNEKLLRELSSVPFQKRTARFVCAMCFAASDGRVLAESRGTYEGLITTEPRGQGGFGYDPLLWLPDAGCTSAELSPEEKSARSHRGKAARAMADLLITLLSDGARRPS